ncbi:MAG TPA: type IV pilus twitching motility protein PilT [Thermodesulfovibrionales bacterium]|jgi:twitching motility protein PilT|nr:type IV pilus twitching motility protein PilT [Thermodesulfovibrionales bacterium]
MATLYELLKVMIEKNASDLHVTTGSPPRLRIDGKLVNIDHPSLNPADTKALCYSVLTDAQKHKYEEDNELDLSFGVKGLSRFRANIFMQRGAVAGAFRTIPFDIRTFNDLGLPEIMNELVKKPRGLILVTGPTGSGKSTTLAAMVDRINSDRCEHIITIEDPIEYLHPHKKCLINQREVHADTASFKTALRFVLRQDPDVVLIGEMRDLETIEAALTVSETGHMTLATLHTNSAVQTINRVIDVFPPHQQDQIRVQLSFVLEGILAQQLIPKKSGIGRVLAVELLVPNPAIRNLIREDKIHQIYSMMQTGQTKFGMQTMNQSLFDLYSRRLISYDDAVGRSSVPDELIAVIQKGMPETLSKGRV